MKERELSLTLQIEQLTRKIEQQEVMISKYKQLSKAVREAETWEYSLYDEIPDETWIALDREGYEAIMKALSDLDEIRPWKTTLEKRIGRV